MAGGGPSKSWQAGPHGGWWIRTDPRKRVLPERGPMRQKYLCLTCRRTFKREDCRAQVLVCPACGNPALEVGTTFRPPPLSQTKKWRVLLYCIERGFRFRRYVGPPPATIGEARRRFGHRQPITEADLAKLAKHDREP